MTTIKSAKFVWPLMELLMGPTILKEGIMSPDERTLIFSLIFSFLLIFAGMLFRYIKYGIPFRESLLMIWQEGIVDGFRELWANFIIPVTKKVISWFLKYKDMLISVLLALNLMAVVLAVKIGSSPIALEVLFVNVFQVFVSEIAIAAFATFLIIGVRWVKRRPSLGILETALHLFFDYMQKKLALKNAQQIAPHLQLFLWQTLYRNKSLLGIDPGPDMLALSPNGWRTAYRNSTVYYVFELAMKDEPELELKILQQLINQFIVSELNNYGIANLSAIFKGYHSVYLDRLVYDDVRRVLMFDVLYVASDQAAAALSKAWERDRPKAAAPEMEVYNDEL